MSSRALWFGGVFLLALGGLMWLAQTEPEPGEREGREEVGRVGSGFAASRAGSERSNPFLSRRWSSEFQEPEEEAETDVRLAVQAGPEQGETTSGWTQLPKSERVARLRAGFNRAIDELEAGNPAGHARAVDALTALRFELHGTPEGRAEYAQLELKLDTLADNP